MKKLILFSFIILTSLTLGSVIHPMKTMGGKEFLKLPVNTKLLSVSHKDDKIWYLIRPMRENEQPEVYLYREHSLFDVFYNSIEISESKDPDKQW